VFPKAYAELLLKYGTDFKAMRAPDRYLFDFKGNQFLAMADAEYAPASVLAAMDRAGIDLSLISCTIPDPGLLPAEFAAEAARVANDEIAELVCRHPGRFAGIAFLPWNVPDAALSELERVAAMGFKSVMLFSHNGGVHADDPSLLPVYKRLEELELPVTVHPTIPLWSGSIGAYGLVATASFVIDTGFALMRLIRSGILEKFPGLKVVMPHAGGVLPYLDGRLSYVPPGARNGPPPINRLSVPEHLKKGNIWCDLSNPSAEVLSYARQYLTADRLILGSDYPFVEPDYLVELLASVFPAEEQEKIFWKNANEVYRLGL
jgi:predicted TIM-barrel fold metal-dependent hydrolase